MPPFLSPALPAVLEASSIDTSDGAGRWSRKTENIETDDEEKDERWILSLSLFSKMNINW